MKSSSFLQVGLIILTLLSGLRTTYWFWDLADTGANHELLYSCIIASTGVGVTLLLFVITLLQFNRRRPLKLSKQENNEALRTRNQLQATLDAIPDFLFEIDAEDYFYNYHIQRNKSFPISPEQFLGKKISEALPGHAAEVFLSALEEARRYRQSTGKQLELALAEKKAGLSYLCP